MLISWDLQILHVGWRAYVLPLVITSLGTFNEGGIVDEVSLLYPNLQRKSIRNALAEMQRAAILGSLQVVRNHLVRKDK